MPDQGVLVLPLRCTTRIPTSCVCTVPCPERHRAAPKARHDGSMNLGFTNTLRTWTLLAAPRRPPRRRRRPHRRPVRPRHGVRASPSRSTASSTGRATRSPSARTALVTLAPGEQPRLRSIVATARRPRRHPDAPHLPRRPPRAERVRDRPRPEHAAIAVTTGLLEAWTSGSSSASSPTSSATSRTATRSSARSPRRSAARSASSPRWAQFQLFFGGGDDERRQPGPARCSAMILAPIAALIIQLAVSRGREYLRRLLGGGPHRRPGVAGAGARDARVRSQQPGLLGRMRGAAPAPQPAHEPGVRAPVHRQPAERLERRDALLDPSARSPSASRACGRCALNRVSMPIAGPLPGSRIRHHRSSPDARPLRPPIRPDVGPRRLPSRPGSDHVPGGPRADAARADSGRTSRRRRAIGGEPCEMTRSRWAR